MIADPLDETEVWDSIMQRQKEAKRQPAKRRRRPKK